MNNTDGAPPRTRTDPTTAWWKLMLAGPCLLAVVVVSAGAGVEAWFLGLFIVLLAFAVTALGAILGLLRLNNRRTGTAGT
jgi:hypothetical protein